MADVFTTLATYAGLPAFWCIVEMDLGGRLVLSFVKVDGRWTMCDVANGLTFLDEHGRFAEVSELLAHPALIRATAGTRAPGGIPYQQYVAQLQPFEVPSMLRAQKQMPLARLVYEVKRRLSLVNDAAACNFRAAASGDPKE